MGGQRRSGIRRLSRPVVLSAVSAAILAAIFAPSPRRSNAQTSNPRYSVSNGAVTDLKTGLTWQQVAPSTTYTWSAATTYCTGLGATLGGSWRLPAIKELQTLIDDARATSPAIDPAFTPTPTDAGFWSSTPVPAQAGAGSGATAACYVGFDIGETGGASASTPIHVRCVR